MGRYSICRLSGKNKPVNSGRNIKLEIEYDGIKYSGWQIQSTSSLTSSIRKKSIQEVIEKALFDILHQRIRLIASGRTDAGVHALAQVSNFKTSSYMPADKLKKALNALLPPDIAIKSAEDVLLDFHSRFSAKSKVYRYLILNSLNRSVFLCGRAYYFPYRLDVKLMRRETRCLLGKHDFKAFCASGSSVKDTIRNIKNIIIRKFKLQEEVGPLFAIEIEADGFLYNMVRNIVGTLVEIGRGKLKEGSIIRILNSRDRRLAGPTAPAEGLYLLKVKY